MSCYVQPLATSYLFGGDLMTCECFQRRTCQVGLGKNDWMLNICLFKNASTTLCYNTCNVCQMKALIHVARIWCMVEIKQPVLWCIQILSLCLVWFFTHLFLYFIMSSIDAVVSTLILTETVYNADRSDMHIYTYKTWILSVGLPKFSEATRSPSFMNFWLNAPFGPT